MTPLVQVWSLRRKEAISKTKSQTLWGPSITALRHFYHDMTLKVGRHILQFHSRAPQSFVMLTPVYPWYGQHPMVEKHKHKAPRCCLGPGPVAGWSLWCLLTVWQRPAGKHHHIPDLEEWEQRQARKLLFPEVQRECQGVKLRLSTQDTYPGLLGLDRDWERLQGFIRLSTVAQVVVHNWATLSYKCISPGKNTQNIKLK